VIVNCRALSFLVDLTLGARYSLFRTMNGSTPLTPRVDDQELYSALCGAASQDVLLMKPSEKALKTMIEDCFGTFDALQRVAAQKDVPLPVRQLALIQFKNHALSHWRSRKYVACDVPRVIWSLTVLD
jgi:hypothetical protein